MRLAAAAQDPSTTDAYFVVPQAAGGPVSGAPISGMPMSGAPMSGAPVSGPSGYPPPYGAPHGYSPDAYSGVAVPSAPPAVADQPAWRVNANPGAHLSLIHI